MLPEIEATAGLAPSVARRRFDSAVNGLSGRDAGQARGIRAMYAVIETGGKQYKVEPGATLQVEKLTAEVGTTVELARVLLVGDGDAVEVGRPTVAGARVVAEVVAQEKADKIVVFRYKRDSVCERARESATIRRSLRGVAQPG